MSKKHFIALANKLIQLRTEAMSDESTPQMRAGRLAEWLNTRNALAEFCASQNLRFNRERWLAYIAGECGPNGGRARACEGANRGTH